MEEGCLRTWWKDGKFCRLNESAVPHMRTYNNIPLVAMLCC